MGGGISEETSNCPYRSVYLRNLMYENIEIKLCDGLMVSRIIMPV